MKALVLLALLAADVVLLFMLSGRIGWGWMSLELVAALLMGIKLIHSAALVLGPALQRGTIAESRDPALVKGLCNALAGVLMVFPGPLSDLVALLLLLPPVKQKVGESMLQAMSRRGSRLHSALQEVSGHDAGSKTRP